MYIYNKPSQSSLRDASSGLRLPASTSYKVLYSCLAGRGPNNNFLHPPLAAVVVVAPEGGANAYPR